MSARGSSFRYRKQKCRAAFFARRFPSLPFSRAKTGSSARLGKAATNRRPAIVNRAHPVLVEKHAVVAVFLNQRKCLAPQVQKPHDPLPGQTRGYLRQRSVHLVERDEPHVKQIFGAHFYGKRAASAVHPLQSEGLYFTHVAGFRISTLTFLLVRTVTGLRADFGELPADFGAFLIDRAL